MSLQGKRVFVSGGAGVIGKSLVKDLLAAGAEIFVGDLKPKAQDFPESVKYRQGDLNFLNKEELDAFKPEVFFHLAATFERSVESYEFWDENFQHNVNLSHHLLSLLKDSPHLKTVIFASSYLIYNSNLYTSENTDSSPRELSESDPISPRNLTGSAKLNHEIELEFLKNFKRDCRFVSPRIFRSYGRGSRDVISRWVRDLLNKKPLSLYGEGNHFDYIFADDVASGLIAFAENINFSGTYNLGSGKSRSVADVISILKSHFPEAEIHHKENPPVYEKSQANMQCTFSLTSWRPKFSLEDGISEIIRYERKNPHFSEENPHSGNILITSLGKKVPLVKEIRSAAQKLALRAKIWGGDMNSNCLGKYFVDEFWQMPPFVELTADGLISFCHEKNIRYIIPARDGELPFFAKHRAKFHSAGIDVMISSVEAVEKTLDKYQFSQYLRGFGIRVIAAERTLHAVHASGYVVKEAVGSGSRSIALNVDAEQAKAFSLNLQNPIFQEYVEGREFTADLYVSREGSVHGCIMRWRDYVNEGESQVTTTFCDKRYEQMVTDLVKCFDFYGHIVVQGIVDSKENLHFIECNPRFGGASSLSVKVGLDSFYWFFIESQGASLNDYTFVRQSEMRMIRSPNDIFFAV